MISIELPGGLKVSGDTLEEADSASSHFSRLIGRKEMASIAGVSERTLTRWTNCPAPPVRLCDFLSFLAKPLPRKDIPR